MQRKSTLTRRPSVEQFRATDLSEGDDLIEQVQTLSSSAAVASTSQADGITLLVRGRPLSTVIQVLADALLQQQAQLRRGREATEAQAKQVSAQLADHHDTLNKIRDDLHLSQRPFALHERASASPSASSSAEGRGALISRRMASADTIGAAVQSVHQQVQQLRWTLLQATTNEMAQRLSQEGLAMWFAVWKAHSMRRVAAKELQATSALQLITTYYARWRRRAAQGWRQRQLIRERHLRAVTRRSEKAILTVYLGKWENFVQGLAAQAAQLRAYQRRIAHQLSISGPATTTARHGCFDCWRRWTAARREERRQLTAAQHAAADGQHRQLHQQALAKDALARWQRAARQRQVSRLCLRLSRVLAAQTCQGLLRRRFHTWMAFTARARRVQRLEVLAADQHKRRVTALARRYFNELRFYRREQQFQRMLRSFEASLLVLADRVGGVEDAVHERRVRLPVAADGGGDPFFLSPPRAGRPTVEVQWSPASDDELFARVENILSRSR